MNRKSIIIRNSSIGLLSQFLTILFSFITRSVFINYIGMELLGVNGTFASVLSALSLSELGFETAVVYSLYQPVHDNDQKRINDIVNILKIFYRCIGIVISLGTVIALPFLKYILNDVNLSQDKIYLYFVLQASATIASYFLVYRRTLLYAKQMEYVYKIVDMVSTCLLNVLQCIMLIVFQSYIVYLILKFVQVIISNIIIHIYCSRHFPYLHKDKLNKKILGKIIQDVKNIFVGKLASFMYSSTDSLVISAFVNTVSVAYYGNYTTIILNLKSLTTGLLAPIAPIVGNFFIEEKRSDNREHIFLLYTHLRVWIAFVIILPVIILLNDFIAYIWLTPNCVLPISVTYLLAVDFYIHLVHSSSVDYINGMGLFQLEKYIELAGAVSNIVFSILFVQLWGISGVIAGTVISQCVFWVGRVAVVYYKGMHLSNTRFFQYWLRNVYYATVFLLCLGICTRIYKSLPFSSYLIKFVLGGLLCEICVLLIGFLCFARMREQKKLIEILRGFIPGSRCH